MKAIVEDPDESRRTLVVCLIVMSVNAINSSEHDTQG